MKFKVEWAEKKNDDWQLVTVVSPTGERIDDVSINRTSKKGEVFPRFDEIKPGEEIEGEFWKSEAGKAYLFPPRPEVEKRGPSGIKAAMERKENGINKTMDRKENGIELSSTFRDATLETNLYFQLKGQPYTEHEWQMHWLNRRAWLKQNYGDMADITETKTPF